MDKPDDRLVAEEYHAIQNSLGDVMHQQIERGDFADAMKIAALKDRLCEARDKLEWLLLEVPLHPFGKRGYWTRHVADHEKLAAKQAKKTANTAKV